MAEETIIAITTTADTSGAEEVKKSLDETTGKAGEAGEALEKDVAGKKGVLDETLSGIVRELGKSIGLSGEAAANFEKMAVPLVKQLGIWGLIAAAIIKAFTAAQEHTAELNRQTVALDDAGFAQKKRSDELIRFLTSAKDAEGITKRRLKIEGELADAQQKANDAVTIGKKKEIEESAAIVTGLQNELRVTVAKEQSARRAEAALKSFADAQKELLPFNQALAEATEKRQSAEIAKQAEILQASKAAQAAETERLKPLTDILTTLDKELAKRKELAALDANKKAAEIAGPAADKINANENRINQLTRQRDNTPDRDLVAGYNAEIESLKRQNQSATAQANQALQKLAADLGSTILKSGTDTANALTQTTTQASDAKTQIDAAQSTLTTAVQAIPSAVSPITSGVTELQGQIESGFSQIAEAINTVVAAIPGIVNKAVAQAIRSLRVPGK